MRRPTLAIAAAGLLLLGLVPGAAAEEGPELNVMCVTLAGEPSDADWDEFTLQDDIAAGAASLTTVSAGADCAVAADGAACLTVAGASPTEGWTQGTLSEAISTGRAQIVLLAAPEECTQVIAETGDPVDTPERLPLEVVESGIVIGESSSSFVVIVSNPNTGTWAAQGLPVAARILDGSGNKLETSSAFVTLLPGQVGAAIGFLTTAGEPRELEAAVEGADFNWLPTELSADLLEISAVKLKGDSVMGFATTGKIHNTGDAGQDGVSVVIVHRNKTGEIIGAEFTFLESIPAGGTVKFETPNLSGIGRKQVAETDVYYQLGSVH